MTGAVGDAGAGAGAATWEQRGRAALEARVPPAARRAVSVAVNRFAAPVLSIAVLGGALWQLHAISWRSIAALMPHRPLFWVAFIAAHLVPIVADWLIYRRLWRLPASGLVPMARKMISNNLLFDHSGEAYLYVWARGRGVATAAFGAVKDVAILSAAVGNSVTIGVTLLALPFMGLLGPMMPTWLLVPSLLIVAVPPATAFLFRRRLFSRPPADLLYIAGVHGARAATGVVMTGLLWQLALPTVALVTWVVLSALKLLVSRLPLISQKDLVFAGVSVALLGRGTDAAALIALMATLSLAADVVIGLAASLAGAAGEGLRRARGAAPAVVPAVAVAA